LTKAGNVEELADRDAIRHGQFDLDSGLLGRRHDVAESLTSLFTGVPIRLYELQDLPGIGGVQWRVLCKEFERSGPVRAGALNVWSFRI
jgi:hypothetical protein